MVEEDEFGKGNTYSFVMLDFLGCVVISIILTRVSAISQLNSGARNAVLAYYNSDHCREVPRTTGRLNYDGTSHKKCLA